MSAFSSSSSSSSFWLCIDFGFGFGFGLLFFVVVSRAFPKNDSPESGE